MASAADLAAAAQAVRQVRIDPAILGYIVELARATRSAPPAALGVSPRGATALLATSRAWAWLSGRDFVTPDDVQSLARPTFRHRIQLRPESELEGVSGRRRAGDRAGLGARPALVVLTGRLVALAALGVLLALWSTAAVLVYAAALAVAVGADLALAARLADLRLHREPTTPVRLGVAGETVLTIGNAGRRRLRGLVRDAWVPSAGAAPRRQTVVVPAGERRRVVTTLTPTRRGERRAARVVVRAFGPLGLAARQRQLAAPGTLQVLPAFASRRYLPEKLSRLRRIDGAVLVRQRGQGSEFDSLRTYVLGDDVRAIDWRATARSRDLVVRTWRPERDRHIVLAVDTGRASAARVGDEPRLDAALDACLLLGALAARAGDRVALVAADVEVRARLGLTGGRDLLPKLVGALAPLEPALVETDPQLLAGQVLRQVSKRALVVLFAALDTAADTGLLPAARTLAARHEVIVASASDPALRRLAAARSDADEVYVAAAAELTGTQRDAVVAELRTLGVHVVDAPADVLAAKVADAYLDLKAAGKL